MEARGITRYEHARDGRAVRRDRALQRHYINRDRPHRSHGDDRAARGLWFRQERLLPNQRARPPPEHLLPGAW